MHAEIGPFTHCHLDFAFESLASDECHALPILCRKSFPTLFHSPVHDLTCSAGMRTLGSAESEEKRPFLNDQRITEVEHVPAAMRPVALAMLDLAVSMLDGDMPTAVKPQLWVGWTPVMAILLAAVFLLHMVSHLRASFWPDSIRSCCLEVVRVLPEDASTPISAPCLSAFMGMPRS